MVLGLRNNKVYARAERRGAAFRMPLTASIGGTVGTVCYNDGDIDQDQLLVIDH